MKITDIAFTGIPVTDMKRAREFYEGVLGLTPDPEVTGEMWMEYPIGSGTLAVACIGDQWKPSDQGTSAALEVENLEDAITRLEEKKIPFHKFDSPVCRMAAIQDPDGNKIVIHKLKTDEEKEGGLMIKEVAFVAVAVSDFERARKFYEETLELKPATTHEGMPWVEYEIGPVTIGVGQHPAWQPSREGTTIAFEVEDIDAAIAKLKERGVEFDMDKMETPVCWMAQFRDPDGNKLVVHKRKN